MNQRMFRSAAWAGGFAVLAAIASADGSKSGVEANPTGISIESVMGKGFGEVFACEVTLEKVPLPSEAGGKGSIYWRAREPGSRKEIRVSGATVELQKKIEAWARDHPGKAVKIAAYESVKVDGQPALPIDGAHAQIEGVPIEAPSTQSRGWSANPELVVVGFAKEGPPPASSSLQH